jgi:hypothetical protein
MARGKGRARVKLNQSRAGWSPTQNKGAARPVGHFKSGK